MNKKEFTKTDHKLWDLYKLDLEEFSDSKEFNKFIEKFIRAKNSFEIKEHNKKHFNL